MGRDATIDEVFTWREDFGRKAKEVFGGHRVDVSPLTLFSLRLRCDKIERESDPFFAYISGPPFNGIHVHVVSYVPDGIIRPCECRERHEHTEPQIWASH